MAHCEFCGKRIDVLPFNCKYCEGTFCSKHRLPENHECSFESRPIPVVPSRVVRESQPKPIRSLQPLGEYDSAKDLKRRLKKQDRYRKKANKIYMRSIPRAGGYGGEIKATPIIVMLVLIMSITAFIFYYSGLMEYIYLSVFGLTRYYIWVIFTAPFIYLMQSYLGFFFLFFYIFFLYNMGINLEKRFGSAFIIRLYLTCTLFTGIFYILIRLSLLPFIPISVYTILPYGLASGALLGILTFICLLFYDTELTLLCMFIPVRMKGKTMLLLLIIFTIVQALFSLYIVFLSDLGGIFAAYVVFRNYTQR